MSSRSQNSGNKNASTICFDRYLLIYFFFSDLLQYATGMLFIVCCGIGCWGCDPGLQIIAHLPLPPPRCPRRPHPITNAPSTRQPIFWVKNKKTTAQRPSPDPTRLLTLTLTLTLAPTLRGAQGRQGWSRGSTPRVSYALFQEQITGPKGMPQPDRHMGV